LNRECPIQLSLRLKERINVKKAIKEKRSKLTERDWLLFMECLQDLTMPIGDAILIVVS
jgi:phage terminase small subunit